MAQYVASLDPDDPKPWQRVWRGGEDVTAEPVDTWPALFVMSFLKGWRPALYPSEEHIEWPPAEAIRPASVQSPHASRKARRL